VAITKLLLPVPMVNELELEELYLSPVNPEKPDTPENPLKPENPLMPENPDLPEKPEIPEPENPEIPEPENPDLPDSERLPKTYDFSEPNIWEWYSYEVPPRRFYFQIAVKF